MQQVNASNAPIENRAKFSSGIAVFLATLSSAIGLGNIWLFPYLTGMGGGATFILLYCIFIVLVGLPIFVCELFIGRKTRKNVVGAYSALASKQPWKKIGFVGILATFTLLPFYSTVGGWVYSYVFKSLIGTFNGASLEFVKSEYIRSVSSPITPILWQFGVITVVAVVLILGVKNGIEKIAKLLMPILMALVILCGVRSLFLPNSIEGLKFLFKFDFSTITPTVVLSALGLAFFKLSIGSGCMVTYGSYFTDDNKLINTGAKVATADTMVSLLAGIAIFPAVFAFGMQPTEGPGLLFMTMPLVFSKMMFGNILMVAFFFITSIAATTAMISIAEVPVAYFSEELKLSRTKSVILVFSIVMSIGIFTTLSANEYGVLGNFLILGKTIFDLLQYVYSNILLLLAGFLTSLFIGYKINKDEVYTELSNNGTLNVKKYVSVLFIFMKYFVPFLILLTFLNSTGIIDKIVYLINNFNSM